MEKLKVTLVVAGIAMFAFAFVATGVTAIGTRDTSYDRIETIARKVIPEFRELARSYPKAFEKAYGRAEADSVSFALALDQGRDVYVAEACWHCHSQFIRPRDESGDGLPVGSDMLRWGAPSRAEEAATELHMPVVYGTRRVGPDLTREGGKRTNGWHVAHFFEPTDVVPTSIMPNFRWLFDPTGRYEVRTALGSLVAVAGSEAEAEKVAASRDAQAFDVTKDPRGRFTVVERGAEERVLATHRDEAAAKADADLRNLFAAQARPHRVGREYEPNARGLSLIAYIQWLGTWDPAAEASKTSKEP